MHRTILLLGVSALLVVGCGDDDGDTIAESGTTPDAGESTTMPAGEDDGGSAPVQLEGTVNDEGGTGEVSGDTLEMELDDNYFGPAYTRAEHGTTVMITLSNEGEAPHTFTIDELGVDEEVEPGDTAEVEVTLPDSGAVRYYCRFHAAAGMQGAFYANEGDTVPVAPADAIGGY